jgi:hypothetical protein
VIEWVGDTSVFAGSVAWRATLEPCIKQGCCECDRYGRRAQSHKGLLTVIAQSVYLLRWCSIRVVSSRPGQSKRTQTKRQASL